MGRSIVRFCRRLWALVRVHRLDAELAEELQFHRAMKEQELQRAGLSPEHARLAARAALGNVTRSREDARAVWFWPWLESVWQDVTYAVRSLRRTQQVGQHLSEIGELDRDREDRVPGKLRHQRLAKEVAQLWGGRLYRFEDVPALVPTRATPDTNATAAPATPTTSRAPTPW